MLSKSRRVAGGLILAASLAATATLLSACDQSEKASKPTAAKPAKTVAAKPGDTAKDPVVGRVNGAEIRLSYLESMKQGLPQQYRALPVQLLFPQLLEQAINGKLLSIAGRAAKLGDDPALLKRLAFIKDQLIQNAYLDRLTKAGQAKATEAVLKKRYEAFLKDFKPKEEVRARHILVKTKGDAETIIAALDKGADFAELAKKNSIGPSKSRGGDLGFFSKGQMVPEFSKAAFQLKDGAYTKEPVKSQFGWHVIKVEERRTAKPPTFKDTRDQLSQAIMREHVRAAVDKLRQAAKIERFQVDGSPVKKVAPAKDKKQGDAAPPTEKKPAKKKE